MSGKIDEMRGAGFSDEEIANYAAQQRKEMQSVGFAPNEIDGYFNGVTVPPDPPKPFLNRLIAGGASVFSLGSKAESAFSQSFSSGGQLGFSDDDEKNLREMGIFRNPETGHGGPLRFMNEAIMRPTAAAVDALMRAPPALIAGLAAGAKEIGRQEGQSEQQGASMERELNLFGNFALQVGGADLPPELSISRPDVNHLGHVHDAPIGGVPKSETFNTAAKAIGGPKAPEAAEQKLLTLYTDHGFHPAEVAHDAANDVTVTQHLLSDGPDLPYGIDRLAQAKGPELDAALAEEGVDPRSVSGDIRDRTLAILAMDAKANPLDAYQHVVADMTRKSIESEPPSPRAAVAKAATSPADILRDVPSALKEGSIDARRFSAAPTTEQLDAIIERGQQHENSEANRLFGDGADEVKKLLKSNSEKASDRLDEIIHDKYGYNSPQNDFVYGMNGAHIVDMDSLRALRDTISNVEYEIDAAAEGKGNILDRELAWLAPKLPEISKPDSAHTESERIALLGLARAFEDMTAKGLDPEPVLQKAIDYSLHRTGGDAEDARVLLEKIVPYVKRWVNEEANVPSAAPPAEGVTRTFQTSKGSTYTLHEDGTTTRDKTLHAGHDATDVGVKARSAKTIYVDKDLASNLSGAGLTEHGGKGYRLVLRDGKATLLSWNKAAERWGASPSSRDIPFTTTPEVGKSPVEMWKSADDVPGHESYRGQHAGNEITSLTTSSKMDMGRPLSEKAAVPNEASIVEQSVPGGQVETLGRPPESGEPARSIVPVGQERAGVPQPATGGAGGGGEIPEGEHPVPSERAGGGGSGGGGDNGSGGTTGAPQPVGPNRPLSDAEEKVLSRVSVGEKDPTRAMTLDRLYTHVMDQLFPLSKATKEAEAELGRKIPTEDNPYQLARLISGVAGKAEHMLNHGMFDFESYENIGPSFKEIIAPVKDDLNGFRAFSTALRAAELEREGIKTGVDMDAARDVVMKGNARYGDTLLKLVDYQRNLARYLKESGVISQAGYDAMTEKWAFYVPFNRVMGEGVAGGPKGAGASLQARNPIHAIEGSGRIIVDPIENIIRNTYLFSSMAEKNAVGVKLIDMLLHMGEISELKEINPVMLPRAEGTRGKELTQFLKGEGVHTAPPDLVDAMETEARGDRPGEISIFRDGKRETYMVDPDLARAFKGLDAASVGFWEKLLSIPANLLRAGATLTPEFAVRHFFRDYIYAAVTADKGVFTPVDSVKGFIGLIAKDADYQKWLKGGGSNITMVSLDRRYLQHDLAKLTGQTGLMTRAWNVIGNPQASITAKARAAAGLPFEAVDHFALSPLRMLTEYAEGASHLGAFKREMRRMEQEGAINKPEIQQAAFTSRDTAVDAARRGASMRAYNMMTAFAQITLQDSDRIVRAIKDNPAKTLLALTLGISVPSALLWSVNHNDPRYKELSDSDRDMHWIFLTDKWMDKGSAGGMPDRGAYDAGNGTSQRIVGGRVQINKGNIHRAPKPFSAGVLFGSGVERSMEAIINQNPHAFDHFTHSLIESMVPNFFPSGAVPFIEQWANRRLFTNRTLIPADMEKLLPEYQYTPYTTEAAKAIGRIVGAFPGIRSASVDAGSPVNGVARAISTPILMENYLRAWTGTLGMYALQAADKALRVQGILPDIPGPTDTLADNPFIRAFTIRYPSANAQSVQDFHDRYGINKRFYATWDARAKAGDRVAMDQIKQAGGDEQFAKLDQFEETLKRQGQVIRLVFKNPRISPDQQRQLIDSTYYGMIQTAHAGLQALDGIEAAIRARGH